MRLGQLARKLEIRPAEIVEFLALNRIQIEEGANTRLEDDLVNMILRQFNPALLTEVIGEATEEKGPEDLAAVVLAESVNRDTEALPVNMADVEVDTPKEIITEVIKAPKVELSGLKVLGKIELPEKKKKEEQPELQADVSVTNPSDMKPQQRTQYNERKGHRPEQRTRKNPIALQREREALEEQKKREEKAELEKERRTRNYHKRVKMSPPTKAVRLVDEPVMQMSAKELEEEPKTWLGRLVKWFTTA
jgi:hypothetical protein